MCCLHLINKIHKINHFSKTNYVMDDYYKTIVICVIHFKCFLIALYFSNYLLVFNFECILTCYMLVIERIHWVTIFSRNLKQLLRLIEMMARYQKSTSPVLFLFWALIWLPLDWFNFVKKFIYTQDFLILILK